MRMESFTDGRNGKLNIRPPAQQIYLANGCEAEENICDG